MQRAIAAGASVVLSLAATACTGSSSSPGAANDAAAEEFSSYDAGAEDGNVNDAVAQESAAALPDACTVVDGGSCGPVTLPLSCYCEKTSEDAGEIRGGACPATYESFIETFKTCGTGPMGVQTYYYWEVFDHPACAFIRARGFNFVGGGGVRVLFFDRGSHALVGAQRMGEGTCEGYGHTAPLKCTFTTCGFACKDSDHFLFHAECHADGGPPDL